MKKEFRKDLVSGDWTLISTDRGKRPHQFRTENKIRRQPKLGCPFEKPERAGDGRLLLALPDEKGWVLKVVPNKYPVVEERNSRIAKHKKIGPFSTAEGIGHHELLITKGHSANFPKLKQADAFLVFKAFRERYHYLSSHKDIAYISNYHNWGPKTGASIYHPHYQILGIPVVPPEVTVSLMGSRRYFKENKKCAHCVQIAWEKKQKKRIVAEDKNAILFTPFVSKEPFEMRVFLKKHTSFFEDTNDEELKSVVGCLHNALNKLEKSIPNISYNFFIHTAPVEKRDTYKHYHWHVEIVPRLNISAGFELGTDIQVNPMDPDDAAKSLRNAK